MILSYSLKSHEMVYKALLHVYEDIDIMNVASEELNIEVTSALETYELENEPDY